MAIVVGLHAAAARAGLPRTSLRRLVAKGQLAASKASDGTWTFDGDELDQLRAAREQAALSGAATASSPMGAPAPVNTPTAMPSTSAPFAIGSIPDWMERAVDARDQAAGRHALSGDEVDYEDDGGRREPFLGIPLGSSRMATPGASWPYSALAGATSTSPRVAELEQQLSGAIAQRDSWYRAARIKSIADTIAAEAMAASSGDVSAAQVVAYAAAQALGSLPVEQLSIDAIAFSLARDVGHRAAVAWQAQQAPWLPPRDPHDEIARARARRRSRSPRW